MTIPILRARRIESEPKIIRLTIEDEIQGITKLAEYELIRECTFTGKEVTVKKLIISEPMAGVSITQDAVNYYIDLVDEAPLNGTDYAYYVAKTDVNADGEFITEYSNTVGVSTPPSKVEGFYISDADTLYDKFTKIPTHLTLSWDEYDTANNNLNVEAFHVYYSCADKGTDGWSQWTKVRGNSTTDVMPIVSDQDITITAYSPDSTSCTVAVPQLSHTERPQDIKFGIVAVTKALQSELSDIDSISTFNVAHAIVDVTQEKTSIVNGSEEDTDLQLVDKELINPHYIITFTSKTFAENTYVWCERVMAMEKVNNKTEYHYRVGSTTPPRESFDVEFYFPLPTNIDYDVRVETNGEMASVPFRYDPNEQRLRFKMSRMTDFKVILIDTEEKYGKENPASKFRDVTRRMIRRLPTWFKMRRNPVDSIGSYFLEVIGIQLEDVELIFKYAREQTSIFTADLSQLSTLCKAPLPPEISGEDSLTVTGDGTVLELSPNLEHFIKSPYFLSEEEMIYHNNMFIIDYEENCLYTRRRFEPTDESEYGEISIKIYKTVEDEAWYDKNVPLQFHQLWNFFDEFGMLLDVKRFKGESNEAYKERILDVFKNPSSSSREGLMNGIARELGIRVNTTWADPKKDFVIEDTMVICNKITVNGEYVPLSDVWYDSSDNIVLRANVLYPEDSEVSYVRGLEMHSLNKKSDIRFQAQLYQPNGLASGMLKRYVSIIKNEIPIEWDKFRWGIGYWDAALPENGGVACLPNITDASIAGFEAYKK